MKKTGFTGRANTIIAASLGLGYSLGADAGAVAGFPDVLELVIGGSGIIPSAFVAIVLNLIIPKTAEDKKLEAENAAQEEAELRAAAAEVAAMQAKGSGKE